MNKAKIVLGFLWALPNSIIGWIILLFLLAFKQIESVNIDSNLTFGWDIKNTGWLYLWIADRFPGFCIGNNIVIVDLYPLSKYGRTYKHEKEHVKQNYKWGILFYPLYFLESIRIYFLLRDLHSYYDNCFEIDARLAAGQEILIPKSQWKDPNDRWIWW